MTTPQPPLDLDEVEARIARHRCDTDTPRRGDADFIDLSQLIDVDAPALIAELKRYRALDTALDRIVAAAEDVLTEAEQAETDAVFSGAAEPKCGPALKALREALNALPAAADEAVAL